MIILFDGLNIVCNVASYNAEETAEATLKEACAILDLACPDINHRPNHYTPVFVWDPTKTSTNPEKDGCVRKHILPTYKANRRQKHAKIVEAISQKSHIKDYLSLYGIKNIEQSGLEADDLIAFICKLAKNKPVVIVSEDKDFLQLVDPRISVIRNNAWIAEHNFHQHMGMTPSQYLDWKILTGDPSDNIPPIKSQVESKQWIHAGATQAELSAQEQELYNRNKLLIKLNLWKVKGAVAPKVWRTAKQKWNKIYTA